MRWPEITILPPYDHGTATLWPPYDYLCGGIVAYDFVISEDKFIVKLSKSQLYVVRKRLCGRCLETISYRTPAIWFYKFDTVLPQGICDLGISLFCVVINV